MMQCAAAGLAGVLGEIAGLQHGDDLVFTIRAGHAISMAQRDEAAFRASGSSAAGDRGVEVDGVALGTGHGAGGRVSRSLAGDKGQCAECGQAEEGGADEFRFHGMFVLVISAVYLPSLSQTLHRGETLEAAKNRSPRHKISSDV